MNRHYFSAMVMVLLTAITTLTSCEYKELDEDYYPEGWTKQSVSLDWDFSKIDSIPGSYRIALYPADWETSAKVPEGLLLFDVYNNRAILRDIPAGNYNITAWNTDTEHVLIKNISDRDKINASTTTFYTSSADPSAVLDSLYYGQDIYNTPEYMTHATKELFTVVPEVQYQPLTLTPDSMCVAIDYRIHGIAALHLAKQVRAAVNNVTKTRLITPELATKDTCVVMSDCLTSISDSIVHGRFFVFGMEPEDFQLMEHSMTLFFWMENKNIFYPIKINKCLRPYRREDNIIYLEIPDIGLDLRKYAASGSFDVNVNEWDEIDKEISW